MSRTDTPPLSKAEETLALLGRLALRDPSMTQLPQVVELVGTAMPAGSEISVSVHARGELVCVSTGDIASALDEQQFADGCGPTVQVARTGTGTEIADVRTDTRWPQHAQRAAAAGLLSSLSIPLCVDAQVGAAMTVFAREAGAFDEEVRRTARRLAPHARSAVASSEARHRARAMADEMEAELEARAIISQAKGILVHRYGLTPERAVELMARMSARSDVDLRQIADGLVRMDRASRA